MCITLQWFLTFKSNPLWSQWILNLLMFFLLPHFDTAFPVLHEWYPVSLRHAVTINSFLFLVFHIQRSSALVDIHSPIFFFPLFKQYLNILKIFFLKYVQYIFCCYYVWFFSFLLSASYMMSIFNFGPFLSEVSFYILVVTIQEISELQLRSGRS